MRKDKEKALALRKSGRSYNDIKKLLSVPKSTLSDWLSDERWSNEIKDRLTLEAKEKNVIKLRRLNKAYKRNLEIIYKEARGEAVEEFKYFKFHPLFIVGVSIYWGEGDKSNRHSVKIANTDPSMIKLFVKFLIEVCGAPKDRIRANVLLYPDLDPKKCKDFWIKKSGLSDKNFTKSVTIEGRHKTRRVLYGVCNVNISSTYLKEKMLVWLTLLPQEFIKDKHYKKEYYSRE